MLSLPGRRSPFLIADSGFHCSPAQLSRFRRGACPVIRRASRILPHPTPNRIGESPTGTQRGAIRISLLSASLSSCSGSSSRRCPCRRSNEDGSCNAMGRTARISTPRRPARPSCDMNSSWVCHSLLIPSPRQRWGPRSLHGDSSQEIGRPAIARPRRKRFSAYDYAISTAQAPPVLTAGVRDSRMLGHADAMHRSAMARRCWDGLAPCVARLSLLLH
jgi:hypothetical protein